MTTKTEDMVFLEDMKSFVKKVIPKDAPDIQIEEMRKAFVSGAKIVSNRCKTLDADDLSWYCEQIDDMFEYITGK